MAECRNKLSKEWRKVERWRIAASSCDELGPSWTDTSEFRVQRDSMAPHSTRESAEPKDKAAKTRVVADGGRAGADD